jgi:hypothetical protein
MSDDLVAFLKARLDEDEAAANALATGGNPAIGKAGQWNAYIEGGDDGWAFEDDAANGVGAIVGSHELAAHIARYDPARAVREVTAKRAIVARHKTDIDPADALYGNSARCEECGTYVVLMGPCPTLRILAAVWSDHRDYHDEWKP